MLIGRTDVEAETPKLWPPDAKSWLIWKDPDAGKGWKQKEKGTTEDEMVGWYHQLKDMSFSKLQELVMGREACHTAVHGVAKSWTWLSDWTEVTLRFRNCFHLVPNLIYCCYLRLFKCHVQMWELYHKEGWALKNWCFWIVVLENSWESLGL